MQQKAQPRTVTLRIPHFINKQTFSKLSIPGSIVFAGIIISISLLIAGNTIKDTVKGLSLGTAATNTNTADNAAPQVTVTPDKVKSIFASADHKLKFGDPNGKALFVEFSDPSCPFCHFASGLDKELSATSAQFKLSSDGGTYIAPEPEMKKLVDEGKAAMVYIYTTGHGNGKLGAQALYCGNEQGKFWDVHNLLMSNAGYNLLNNTVKNDVANSGQLADFLSSAIDKGFMQSCLESKKYASQVDADDQFAASVGIQGTPGFFINDKVYNGAYNWNDMKSDANKTI